METERHQKRRRIGNHADYVQPCAIVSSFEDSIAPLVPDPPVTADEYYPSAKDVSTTVRNIENPSSRSNSLQALKQLRAWLMDEQIQSSMLVLENFYCYGGIARILDFMEVNIDEWDCVVGTTAAIADFLSFRWNTTERNRKIAIELANMIVRRKGIQLLLRANREHAIMHKISSDTKYIWIALGRTMNGEETRDSIDKDQLLCILNDAIDCIYHLEEIGNSRESSNSWTSDVIQVVLYAIANTIKDPSIEKDVLKRIGLVALCLRIMSTNDDWIRNDAVVTYALGILCICAKQKAVITKQEFEQLLPSLIYCMRNFGGDTQIRTFIFVLLECTCEKVQKKMIESTGGLEAISALLKSEGLGGQAKEKARVIIRKIIN